MLTPPIPLGTLLAMLPLPIPLDTLLTIPTLLIPLETRLAIPTLPILPLDTLLPLFLPSVRFLTRQDLGITDVSPTTNEFLEAYGILLGGRAGRQQGHNCGTGNTGRANVESSARRQEGNAVQWVSGHGLKVGFKGKYQAQQKSGRVKIESRSEEMR